MRIMQAEDLPGRTVALWARVLVFLYLALVFVSAFNRIQDSDVWMHLSHGRLLWDLKGFPEHEVFLYTATDMPFLYTSWVFGVLVYLVHRAFDYGGLTVLKTAAIMGAFIFLMLDALRPRRNHAVAALALSLVAIISQYRFVLRPDIFQMLFLSFTIFALNAYLYDGKRYVYALPFVHLLWANMHSSVLVIHAVYPVFLVGGLLQGVLNRRAGLEGVGLEGRGLKVVLGLYGLSALASAASPNLAAQLAYGPEVLSNEWYRHSIVELWAPTPKVKLAIAASIAAVAASFVLAGRRMTVTHLLLAAPFAALPFQGDRFQFLFAIVAGPIFARNAALGLERFFGRFHSARGALHAVAALWLAAATVLTYQKVPPFGEERFTFGPGVDLSGTPAGVVRFMEENGIEGRILNPYALGQFFIWRGYPKWTVFVDAKGYLPVARLEEAHMFPTNNLLVDSLHKAYGFETIVMENPMAFYFFGGEALETSTHGLANPDWKLVYWDDIAFVYLRQGGPYASVIAKHEYRRARPDIKAITADMVRSEEARAELEGELLRAVREGGSVHARVQLGKFHYLAGRYAEAIESLRAGLGKGPYVFRYDALVYTARAYRAMGEPALSASFYDEALGVRKDVEALLEAAELAAERSDHTRAVNYLREALAQSSLSREVHLRLIEALDAAGDAAGADSVRAELEAVSGRIEAGERFKRGLAAYNDNRYEDAAREYAKAIELDPSNPKPYMNLGYIYLDSGYLERARDNFARALSADPGHYPAFYALGLYYKKTGDAVRAIEYFSRYVEAAPEGHYRRQARKQIGMLRAGR